MTSPSETALFFCTDLQYHWTSLIASQDRQFLVLCSANITAGGDKKWRRRSPAGPEHKHNLNQDEEPEAKARLRVQQEQRHLQTYWSMHRYRNFLHRRYCSLLSDKLHSQRLHQERARAPPTSPNHRTTQKKHKMTFSKLTHNDEYLKDIPKTSYYLIFELQNELVQHGHLQTPHKLEAFYNSIQYNRHPSKLQRGLLHIKTNMLNKKPAVTVSTPCDTDDSDTEHDMRLAMGGSESDQCTSDSLEMDEFEQMFLKMKMPTFLTLQPNFTRNFQSTLPHSITHEIPKKSRKAEIYLKLLDRKIDSVCWLQEENQKIPELTHPDIDSHKKATPSLTLSQLNDHYSPLPSAQDKFNQVENNNLQTFGQSVILENMKLQKASPEPLCIEDVCGEKDVKVISCGLKLWKNYTLVSE
ncbi:hypothetical protein WMY93_018960 [Mugilogobius chulae]|uniref:Uncharacterized protein n=1 Tax=Mugilogobius chulae TaxID=88201 RepID=A0AAW0NX37_9GOBI